MLEPFDGIDSVYFMPTINRVTYHFVQFNLIVIDVTCCYRNLFLYSKVVTRAQKLLS